MIILNVESLTMKNKTSYIVAALFSAAFLTSHQTQAQVSGTAEVRVVSKHDFEDGTSNSTLRYAPRLSVKIPLFSGGSAFLSTSQEFDKNFSNLVASKYHGGLILSASRLSLATGVRAYTYSWGKGQDTQSYTAKVWFDDTGLWSIPFKPYVTTEQFFNPKSGSWYETGVSPTKTWGDFSVKVPIKAGVRSADYKITNLTQTNSYLGLGLGVGYNLTKSVSINADSTYYTTNCQFNSVDKGSFVNQASLVFSF
jgi:hypothetical protein